MPSAPAKPRRSLHSERLSLVASASPLAAAVLDFQRRNAAHFAPWDPPPAADFLTLRVQQRRLRARRQAFAAGTAGATGCGRATMTGAAVVGQVHVVAGAAGRVLQRDARLRDRRRIRRPRA